MCLLHVLMDRRFLRGDEAGSHVHALGAHGEGSDERAAIGHAAGRDEREFPTRHGRPGQEDHVRHVILAGVSAALEAVDRDRIAADILGLQRVAHRGAFVDHLDAGILEMGHHLLSRVAAGRLDHFHAALDDRFHDGRIVRRGQAREGR